MSNLVPLVKDSGMLQGVRYKPTRQEPRAATPPLDQQQHPISITTAVKQSPHLQNSQKHPAAYRQRRKRQSKEDKQDMDEDAFVAPWNIGTS